MAISVRPVGSGSSPASFTPSKSAAGLASQLMKELDTNHDGTVTKQEFVAALSAKGVSADEAGKLFDAFDKRQTGAITQSDIASTLKSAKPQRPAGGHPHGGHPPTAPAGQASSSSTPAAQTYDPADTNHDGKVSAEEALAYGLLHPTTGASTGASNPPGSTIDQQA